MKASGAILQGVLATAGLVAAYATWQREPETGAGEAVVLDTSKADIQRIRYDDPHKWVEIDRQVESGEPVMWVREGSKAPILSTDAGTPDGGVVAASALSTVEKVREFRGNEQAERLYERFAPLKASRALGALPPEKLKEVGLDNPDRKVEVTVRGAPHVFEVGTSALGVNNPYLESQPDGHVYLVRGSLVSDLEFASTRLVDRRLHEFKPDDWDELSVKLGDQSRDFVVSGAKLAPKKTPAQPDDFAKNWHDRIWRVIVTEVLGKGEVPPAGEPKVELRLDYRNRGKSVGFLELGHAGHDLFARTEHTAGWMKLPSNASELLGEAKKVTSGS